MAGGLARQYLQPRAEGKGGRAGKGVFRGKSMMMWGGGQYWAFKGGTGTPSYVPAPNIVP